MIRTRDFLLYIVICVFILIGIVFTVAHDVTRNRAETTDVPNIIPVESTEITVNTEKKEIDRTANLLAIREKILRGEGIISAGEPVFTSVDTPTTSPTDATSAADLLLSRSVQYCASRTYSATALLWGSSRAVFKTAEGVRLVLLPKRIMSTTSSSTEVHTIEQTVLQLSLFPYALPSPACIDSDYIGVALDGSLMHNDEAWRYRTYAPESIIGYARDGFPIYGAGVEETQLDQCGGFNDGSGYRYHIRKDEMFILGCFAGMPASFIDS